MILPDCKVIAMANGISKQIHPFIKIILTKHGAKSVPRDLKRINTIQTRSEIYTYRQPVNNLKLTRILKMRTGHVMVCHRCRRSWITGYSSRKQVPTETHANFSNHRSCLRLVHVICAQHMLNVNQCFRKLQLKAGMQLQFFTGFLHEPAPEGPQKNRL